MIIEDRAARIKWYGLNMYSDPPYDKFDYLDIFNKSVELINRGGIFCMEMRKRNVDKNIFRSKIYGNTQVILWEAP